MYVVEIPKADVDLGFTINILQLSQFPAGKSLINFFFLFLSFNLPTLFCSRKFNPCAESVCIETSMQDLIMEYKIADKIADIIETNVANIIQRRRILYVHTVARLGWSFPVSRVKVSWALIQMGGGARVAFFIGSRLPLIKRYTASAMSLEKVRQVELVNWEGMYVGLERRDSKEKKNKLLLPLSCPPSLSLSIALLAKLIISSHPSSLNLLSHP